MIIKNTYGLVIVAPDVVKRVPVISALIQLSWLPTLKKNCTGFSFTKGISLNLSVNSIPVNI